ncbi:MAG: peptide ABC transporter substrate-binding protein, partial [Anaerolineae bacterium]|nr:peptide ABC transporter substrate-binding protein [Anaerolineae bacterium]
AGPRRVDLRTYVPPLNPVFETADPNATPGDTNYFGPQGLVDATPGPFWTPRPTSLFGTLAFSTAIPTGGLDVSQFRPTIVPPIIRTPLATAAAVAPNFTLGAHVYRGTTTTDIPTLDPQLATDSVSITYIENLFVQLTNYDLETSEAVPEAATRWEISEDGLTYTFHLRTDIPWVRHNPVTGETIQEVAEGGNPRFVTAYDFEYGIKRMCHPEIGAYYSTIIAPLIVGCAEVLEVEEPDEVTEADFEAIGVHAADDATLVIELTEPAGYFIQMTPMWPMTAVPRWAIEEHEDDWIEAGLIVTSGRFVLHEWVHGVRRILVRNPIMPIDLAGGGNIERIEIQNVPDAATSYTAWHDGEIEQSGIPSVYLDHHLATFPDETDQIPDLAVFYIIFNHSQPPFDDRRVRAAFSAAFEREPFIEQVRQKQGLPMIHFTPPGIFGAPGIDEVGVGYDPDYARHMMEEAGYPNCEGFPEVYLLGYSGASTLAWIEYAHESWVQVLGCDPEVIQIEQYRWGHPIMPTTPTPALEPHMWTLGWGPDYSDANNWVFKVLWCEGGTRTKRPCTWIDELMIEAAQERDPEKRKEMYRRIEYGFFGYGGEFPIAPIFLRAAYTARHAWLERTPALFGGEQWYEWRIDAGLYWDAVRARRQGDE